MDNFDNLCVQDFYMNLTVKEFWKSVYVCRSYDQKASVLFFETQCTCCCIVWFYSAILQYIKLS